MVMKRTPFEITVRRLLAPLTTLKRDCWIAAILTFIVSLAVMYHYQKSLILNLIISASASFSAVAMVVETKRFRFQEKSADLLFANRLDDDDMRIAAWRIIRQPARSERRPPPPPLMLE